MSESMKTRGRGFYVLAIFWALFFFAGAAQAASAWFNVKDYGAVGNGTTNDAAAINSALAAIPTRGGVLYFPPGEYAIGAPIALPNKNIFIRGDGMSASVLKWTSVSGGLTYAPTLQDRELALADIALTTTAMGSGTAITAQWPEVVGAVHRTINIQNVEIRGSDFNRSWSVGLRLVGARTAKIDNLTVLGQPSSVAAMATGVSITSSGGAADIYLNNPVIIFADTAIRVEGGSAGVGNGPEGVYINQGSLVNVNTGVRGVTGHGEPLLFVRGVHINSFGVGIISNFIQAIYSDNLLYQQANSNGLIVTGAATEVLIRNNVFMSWGGSNGVVIEGAARRVSITGNHFNNHQTAIWLQSGSSEHYVAQNVFSAASTRVLNQGTGNTVLGWGSAAP